VIGDANGGIKIYNESSSWSLVKVYLQAHSQQINRIKQSPFNTNNTNYVATCANDYTVKIWSVSSSLDWTLITTYSHAYNPVIALEWLDTYYLASAGRHEQIIKIWSLTTGQTIKTITTLYGSVGSLKLLNNNIHLAVGLNYGFIGIYNINDGNLVSMLGYYYQGSYIFSTEDFVQISDELLASSNDDEIVRIWDLTTNTPRFNLTEHTDYVFGLKQVSFDVLASGSKDALIKLWNITSGEEIRTLRGHTDNIFWSVDLLNSQTLVSGSSDKTIKLWNWSTGECLSTIQTYSVITSLVVIDMNPKQQLITNLLSKFSYLVKSLSFI